MKRLIYASSVSAFINAVFVTAITVFAELNAPLKDWLKEVSGHHWTSKSIISVALFVASFALFYTLSKNVDQKRVREAISLALWSAVAGAITIFLFYTGHDMGWF